MNAVAAAGSLLLAAVFMVAALAKLADREGSRKALVGFGFAAWLAEPLIVGLPLAELAIAGLLLVPETIQWGGLFAAALLVIFTLGIGVSLLKGRSPECHCFGQLHSAPAGWPTLLRNALFAAVAGVVAVGGRAQQQRIALQAMSDFAQRHFSGGSFAAVAIIAVVIEGWLIVHLFRQHGRLLLRLDSVEIALEGTGLIAAPVAQTAQGLAVGSIAPPFNASSLSGELISLERLCAHQKPVLLAFSDPGCGPCNALLPDVARWEREHDEKLTIVVVSRGTAGANRAKLGHHRIRHVLIQDSQEIARKYQVLGTPAAVVVRSDGTIGSPLAAGALAIAGLVARATGSPAAEVLQGGDSRSSEGFAPQLPAAASGLPIGHSAPAFSLLDLNGTNVESSRLQGRHTLLIFWNPKCGFCTKMLPDLKLWERRRPDVAPRIVMISTGTVESNRAMQLASTVLLDQRFIVGASFGVTGTPSAILMDSDGNVASDIAVGASNVLALASVRPQTAQIGATATT